MREALTWDHLDEVMAQLEDDDLYAFMRTTGKTFQIDPAQLFHQSTITLPEEGNDD